MWTENALHTIHDLKLQRMSADRQERTHDRVCGDQLILECRRIVLNICEGGFSIDCRE